MGIRHLLAAIGFILGFAMHDTQGFAADEGPRVDWHRQELPALEGGALDPALFEGKVVLLVNTASFCGFTPQYDGLQAVWEDYRDQGLVVLGVPSNDFGAQEPGSDGEIKRFCEGMFGIDFPMLSKQTVRGDEAHALYRWVAEADPAAGTPKWNFHKFLIGRDGRYAGSFATVVGPQSPELTRAIERELGKNY